MAKPVEEPKQDLSEIRQVSKSPQKKDDSVAELTRQLTEGKERLMKENNRDKPVLPIMKIKQIREKRQQKKQGLIERVKSAVSHASSQVSDRLRRSLSRTSIK